MDPARSPTPASFESVAIDSVRDYWDARPCNIRHSVRPIGTKAYFDEVEARKYLVEPHIVDFAELGRWKGRRVLEVGCGIGTDTMSFARAGAHVTAVDLSSSSLDLARRRAEVLGLEDRVTFVRADAESLADHLPVTPYDLVYSFGVVHHTPHPQRAMQQLRRYVAPGGTVKVMVYNRWSWKVLAILVTEGKGRVWDVDALVAQHSEAQTGCPVTYSYTRRGGRELLEQTGLRVTDVRVEHIFPYRVSDYVAHRYVKRFPFRALPAPVFRALEHRLGWHLCLTAVAPEPGCA